MNINNVFDYNKQWIDKKLCEDKEYFRKLTLGQSPNVLYIGCSDSRVAAEELLGAEPGEVFVHRNIANLVVNIDMNIMAVLTYAIEHLRVKDIVIAGHYFCGGVEAAMKPGDLGFLNPWLRNIRNVYRLHVDELDAITNEVQRFKRLVELNVLEQCINVTKTAMFQTARHDYGIELHGWVFDMESGCIVDLDFNIDKQLENIKSIYDLKNYDD